jgi:mercuric ion transport protein
MKEALLAAGGVLGGVGASLCCTVPLVLVAAGVSGASIGGLGAFARYQPIMIAVSVICLGAGFWLVYRRGNKVCDIGKPGNSPGVRLIKNILWVKVVLWVGAAVVALSLSIDFGVLVFL